MLQFLRRGGKRIKLIWWVVTIATVGSFVLGFIFLPGAMRSMNIGTGDVGSVNGMPVSHEDYLVAIAEQKANYQRQYGMEPADRDLKMIEVQAWRSTIVQRLLAQKARQVHLAAYDREVVLTLQAQPPLVLRMNPAFQTDGQFDPAKFQAELKNPNNNWSAYEELVRKQIPMRKFQERMLSSIKVTEPELREAYLDRFERASATVVQVPPTMEAQPPAPSDADLQRVYDQYKSRFAHGARTQLEVLIVPKQYGAEELKVARELATSLVRRTRSGEDFAALARDYSEGPGAQNGGVLNRLLQPADLSPAIAQQFAAMDTGSVTEPLQDGGRFLIFKLLGRETDPQTGAPGFRVAQIVVKVRPDEEAMRKQLEDLERLRGAAQRSGLGKAAAARGLATSNTGFFEMSNPPQELFTVPEAADWGLNAKAGAVSPVFSGIDEFVVVQVTKQEAPGIAPREELMNQLRQIAQLDAAVAKSKPKADQVAAALRAGKSLEEAAAAAGLEAAKIDGMTRAQPDPRFSATPETVGKLFASKPGQVVGPIRSVNGWFFARLDKIEPADPAMFEQVKQQFANDLVQGRQQAFYNDFLAKLRAKAKIEDHRAGAVPQ